MPKVKAKTRDQYIELICEEIATSSKGLQRICDEQRKLDADFPSRQAFFKWMHKEETVRAQYESAKELQVDALIDEIIEISDDSSQDELVDEYGNSHCNKEFITRSRVRIDTRKWIIAHLKPKVYGDNSSTQLAEMKEEFEKCKELLKKVMSDKK